ncbi:MAG: hypothetical protein HRT56_02130, partial [Coraliomargarita sp.]|nr:hypothetical protein [Coraliomargarita sp.]
MSQYPDNYHSVQLYDLSKDPEEQVNPANNPEYAARLAQIQAELKAHPETLPSTFRDFYTALQNCCSRQCLEIMAL